MTKLPGTHTEAAFEMAIVADLVAPRGWAAGDRNAVDRQHALVPADLFAVVEATSRSEGPGHNYLVQHSAGRVGMEDTH